MKALPASAHAPTGITKNAPVIEGAVVPIILAAGSARELSFPKALARFGCKTAVEIALANCRSDSRKLGRPILVLGERAAEVRRQLPAVVLGNADCVVNRRWRQGQLTSIKSALRLVPLDAAFMIYPVDLPLLTRDVIQGLVEGYRGWPARPCIIMPRFMRRFGHPVIFSPDLRGEIMAARTARDVAYRDLRRIHAFSVRTSAIWTGFSTPAEYERCLRRFISQAKRRLSQSGLRYTAAKRKAPLEEMMRRICQLHSLMKTIRGVQLLTVLQPPCGCGSLAGRISPDAQR